MLILSAGRWIRPISSWRWIMPSAEISDQNRSQRYSVYFISGKMHFIIIILFNYKGDMCFIRTTEKEPEHKSLTLMHSYSQTQHSTYNIHTYIHSHNTHSYQHPHIYPHSQTHTHCMKDEMCLFSGVWQFCQELRNTHSLLSIFYEVSHFFSRCAGCETVLSGIEEQVVKANSYKEQQNRLKANVETEVSSFHSKLNLENTPVMHSNLCRKSCLPTEDIFFFLFFLWCAYFIVDG